MSYLVLARKWRPQTFRELIGQDHVSQTLKNAIDSGRVAHAFLFTGGRGMGKTSAARLLAKALNCEQGPAPEPCNTCSACAEITAGNSVDVFEIDGASNTSVDDIRELRETVKYLPSRLRFKIFIIDEVHMLSTSAFNALLKTLEEPPPHVKFIFATTEAHKVPITILSRCQRFDFKRIPLPLIVARLRHILEQEQVAVSDAALTMIARKGDGSMRDSLSTLDQVLAFCGERVSDEEVVTLLGVVDRRLLLAAARAVFAGDCPAALDIVKRVDAFGCNMRHFCQELIDQFRSMAIIKAAGGAADLADLPEAERAELEGMAAAVTLADLQRHLTILLKAESDMAHSTFARLILEMALLKMATLAPVVPVSEILERLKALAGRNGGASVASPQPAWDPSPRQGAAASRAAVPGAPPKVPAAGVSQPAAPARKDPPPSEAPAEPVTSGGDDPWSGFVSFVRGKKPMLASLLEHGHPFKVSPVLLELGFPADSFQLKSLKEPGAGSELQALARGFFRAETGIRLVSLTGEKGAPPSLLEKKSLEEAGRVQRMKELAGSHPMVGAALDIFGGELGEVREPGKKE
ncbi:MAG: DNA polymerase III subunit gamma/tau [Geobacteraceae bacterium]|nr:DNA polymerase III subunit gamma/tau [Geobacteraceae bacterium]